MIDQAYRLRELFGGHNCGMHSLAVASGKGGVGKTNLAVNLSVVLSQRHQRVLLLDADLGLANVDVALGLMPQRTMAHVVAGEASVREAMIEALPGLWVLSGASGLADLANLNAYACERLMVELSEMRTDFNWLVIDTAPGIAANGLAFAAAATEILLVTTPEPTALTDAYAFLKVLFERQSHARNGSSALVQVVVNMVSSDEQGYRWGVHLQRVAERFQQRSIDYLGSLPFDTAVGESVRQQQPFVLKAPTSPAAKALRQLGGELLKRKTAEPSISLPEVTRRARSAATVA